MGAPAVGIAFEYRRRTVCRAVRVLSLSRPTINRRRSMRNLALLLASLLIGGCLPSVLSAQAPKSSRGESVLTPGDSVRIVVWRKPEFSGEFAVAADGSISHPLYQAVRVGGVPLAKAQANMRSFLEKFDQEPQFVMVPLFRVAIQGEVNRPSMYALSPETTIGEAVAHAGGPTQFGRLDRVRLLRSGANGAHTQVHLDLTHPETGAAQMPIRSGDQILVERRRSTFSEVILPTLTVIGALASIGIFIHQYSR